MSIDAEGAPRIVAAEVLTIASIPAHPSNYDRATRSPSLIVLHATDGCESTHADIDGAHEIAKALPKGSKKSWHYIVDADSAVVCVPDEHIAWHAGHHANQIGIGVEICGRANQSRDAWYDPTSHATLCNAARLVAGLCIRWNIPALMLDASALARGAGRGITTHAACSECWHESDHSDPGPNFPLLEFVHAVRVAIGVSSVPSVPTV